MLLSAANFGVYVRGLWFYLHYLIRFCFSNMNRESHMIQGCFCDLHWEKLALLNIKEGCSTSFNLQLKGTSWACLLGSRLKIIFDWNAQILTFFKALFSSFAEVFMSCSTLKRDLLSANNFALENKLFIYHLYKLRTSTAPEWNLGTIKNNSLFSINQKVRWNV